jgi:hypothetical protein
MWRPGWATSPPKSPTPARTVGRERSQGGHRARSSLAASCVTSASRSWQDGCAANAGSPAAMIVIIRSGSEPMRFSSPIKTARSPACRT